MVGGKEKSFTHLSSQIWLSTRRCGVPLQPLPWGVSAVPWLFNDLSLSPEAGLPADSGGNGRPLISLPDRNLQRVEKCVLLLPLPLGFPLLIVVRLFWPFAVTTSKETTFGGCYWPERGRKKEYDFAIFCCTTFVGEIQLSSQRAIGSAGSQLFESVPWLGAKRAEYKFLLSSLPHLLKIHFHRMCIIKSFRVFFPSFYTGLVTQFPIQF